MWGFSKRQLEQSGYFFNILLQCLSIIMKTLFWSSETIMLMDNWILKSVIKCRNNFYIDGYDLLKQFVICTDIVLINSKYLYINMDLL